MKNDEHILKQDVFDFFNYKWERVPDWGEATETKYRNWYLRKYNFESSNELAEFLDTRSKCADIGSGLGRDVKFFRELAPTLEITAVDQSEPALKVISERYPSVQVVRQDITNSQEMLDDLGDGFDFISCDQVLHHTPNPLQVLKTFASMLAEGGVLHFFVCAKKNEYRDLVDDVLMHHARNLTPERLWQFAETVTTLGKELHEIHEGEVEFRDRSYESLQNFVHNQVFRCWYDPAIPFELSVSSNYDWFSNNPRYSVSEVESWMADLSKSLELVNLYSDDACVAVVARRIGS